MHHDDREMSALGPVTDRPVSIPIPLRQRRSVGCFTYPPFVDILKRNGYSVTVDPMFTGTWQLIEEPFHRFIGAERLSEAEWPRSRTRTALLLDPDTGVGAKATEKDVTLGCIIAELKQFEIVFSFDQSFSRGQSVEEKMSEKLNGLRKKGAYGFYYNSHAKFLFAASLNFHGAELG